MSIEKQVEQKMTVEQYLASELEREVKHEFIDGDIYAMSGASRNHNRISSNIIIEFGNHLKDKPCEPFGSDMKIRVRDNFYYPDVLVDCDVDESQSHYSKTPVIIVEVLSPSTRKNDERYKLIEYLNIPTLQEYVLIEQDFADVTVYRKSDDWHCKHYFLGEDIYFESIDMKLSVDDIYQRVHNDEVIKYVKDKQA